MSTTDEFPKPTSDEAILARKLASRDSYREKAIVEERRKAVREQRPEAIMIPPKK